MKIIKGDLLALAKLGEFDLIGQGNNCQNIWGAGLALQMKIAFPDAYIIDKEYGDDFHNRRIEMMGNFSRFWYSDEKERGIHFWVVNMYTQFFPGGPSPGCDIPFDYDAFTVICKKINHMYKGQRIGLPWIGCGLAGAFQPMVANIMNDNLKDMDLTVVEYDNNQKNSRQVAGTRLGDASRDGEGINNGSKGSRGEGYVAGDTGGRGTVEAAGRAYWIEEKEADNS